MSYAPVFIVFFSLLASYVFGYTPILISLFYIFVSILTIIFYAQDKQAAKNDKRRTPENKLHLLSLLCGWSEAIIAQKKFRHKTKKKSFRMMFWLTVIVNSIGLAWVHTQAGQSYLHEYIYEAERLINKEINSNPTKSILSALLDIQA